MLRTLFIEEIRTQVGRNAATLGVCIVVLLGFLGLWWLLADVDSLAALMQIAASLVLVAMPVVVLVQIAVEYWQSMYGQRGYLTQAVPVRGRVHVTAKLLYACLMGLMSVAFALVGLVGWCAALAHSKGVGLSEILESVRTAADAAGPGLTTFLIVSVLIGFAAFIVEVAAVMSIGAQGRYSHAGFGAPLIGFVVLYVVNQLLGLVSTLFLPLSIDVGTGDLTTRMMWPEFLESVGGDTDPAIVGAGSVIVSPLLAAVLVWWAVRAIERHMSLR